MTKETYYLTNNDVFFENQLINQKDRMYDDFKTKSEL